jgi:hypothetical protein
LVATNSWMMNTFPICQHLLDQISVLVFATTTSVRICSPCRLQRQRFKWKEFLSSLKIPSPNHWISLLISNPSKRMSLYASLCFFCVRNLALICRFPFQPDSSNLLPILLPFLQNNTKLRAPYCSWILEGLMISLFIKY